MFLFASSFIVEGMGVFSWGYGLRALAMGGVFAHVGILQGVPLKSDFYAQLAWFSALLVVVGFLGAAIVPIYSVAFLHVSFIAGFTLMIYAVATMVILAHAGKRQLLEKPLWILWVVFIGVLLVAFKRFAVIFFPDSYFKFLGMASTIWILTAAAWLFFILPKIFVIPGSDEFGKMHEEVKHK